MLLTDDPMETDADRRAAQIDDIDIDLDLGGEEQPYGEDEYMSEGVEAFDEHTLESVLVDNAYNDDYMADYGDLAASIQDEDLQDADDVTGAQADEDDEIVDAVDAVDAVDNLSLPSVYHVESQQEENLTFAETASERVPNDQLPHLEAEQEPGLAEERDSFEHETDVEPSHGSPVLPAEETKDHIESLPTSNGPEEADAQALVANSSANQHSDIEKRREEKGLVASEVDPQEPSQTTDSPSSVPRKADDLVPQEVDDQIVTLTVTELNDAKSQEKEIDQISPITTALGYPKSKGNYEDQTKDSTYIHPIAVTYQGSEISLFPHVNEERDFLLDDEHLADGSITSLLAACRPVLGEDVDGHELIIIAPDLELYINEFADEATNITLSQLINIYSQLQHHDGIETPKAFRLILIARPTISHRLDLLRNAVEEGMGLSQIKSPQQVYDADLQGHDDQEDKHEDTNPKSDALIPNDHDLLTQDYADENKGVFHKTKETAFERTMDVKGAVFETVLTETNGQPPGHGSHEDLVDKVSDQNTDTGVQSQHEDGRALHDEEREMGEEEIVDYEGEDPDPKSSEGSSTLQGDSEIPADPRLSSSEHPIMSKDGGFPKAESSSQTLEPAPHDPANQLDPKDGRDDLFDEEDGYSETEDLDNDDSGQDLEALDRLTMGNQPKSHSGNVQDHNSFTYQSRPDESFGVLESGEYHSQDNLYEQLQALDGDVNELEGPVDSTFGDSEQTQEQINVSGDVIEGAATIDVDRGDNRESDIAAAKLTVARENEDDGDVDDALASTPIQDQNLPATQVSDEDEFVFEDDLEVLPSSPGKEELPSLGPLKRSRCQSNADDTLVDDLQDPKRIRSG